MVFIFYLSWLVLVGKVLKNVFFVSCKLGISASLYLLVNGWDAHKDIFWFYSSAWGDLTQCLGLIECSKWKKVAETGGLFEILAPLHQKKKKKLPAYCTELIEAWINKILYLDSERKSWILTGGLWQSWKVLCKNEQLENCVKLIVPIYTIYQMWSTSQDTWWMG